MARLPSGQYLIQQIGEEVILFEEITEVEVGRFNPASSIDSAKFQKVIHDSELPPADKAFAHFWSGYFYGRAAGKILP
jgi:hypothetical protein